VQATKRQRECRHFGRENSFGGGDALRNLLAASRTSMEYEITPPTAPDETPGQGRPDPAASSFQISLRPVVATASASAEETDAAPLPRSYGTESLTLLARDPHTIFAFWDIDWQTAFRDLAPPERKVHLRLFDANGNEATSVHVEPMAGNSYITVPDADAAYSGEIGFFHPEKQWNRLASSGIVTTPRNAPSTDSVMDFATVPFHLSFQRMVDLLETTQQENATLTAMLADLRARVTGVEGQGEVTAGQRELAATIENVAVTTLAARAPASDPRMQQKLERILGFGRSNPTSPAGGFGGSSRAL